MREEAGLVRLETVVGRRSVEGVRVLGCKAESQPHLKCDAGREKASGCRPSSQLGRSGNYCGFRANREGVHLVQFRSQAKWGGRAPGRALACCFSPMALI